MGLTVYIILSPRGIIIMEDNYNNNRLCPLIDLQWLCTVHTYIYNMYIVTGRVVDHRIEEMVI